MKISSTAAILSALLGVATTGPAFGLANIGTWSFLRNSPAELFSDQDWAIFEAALNQALDNNAQGVVKTWENPRSQFSGEITVLRTVTRGNNECRAVRITNQASNRSRTSEQIFCKSGNGAWRLAPPR
jgi:surface antigen